MTFVRQSHPIWDDRSDFIRNIYKLATSLKKIRKKIDNIETTEHLFKHFEMFIELTENLKVELSNRLKPIVFRKGELILDANRICTESYFISKGIMRTYYLKEGKEISEFFSTSNEWVNSPKSFIQQKKDIYYIDAIENIEAYFINVNDLVYLFNNFPEMERYARLSMGSVFGHLMNVLHLCGLPLQKKNTIIFAKLIQTFIIVFL